MLRKWEDKYFLKMGMARMGDKIKDGEIDSIYHNRVNKNSTSPYIPCYGGKMSSERFHAGFLMRFALANGQRKSYLFSHNVILNEEY